MNFRSPRLSPLLLTLLSPLHATLIDLPNADLNITVNDDDASRTMDSIYSFNPLTNQVLSDILGDDLEEDIQNLSPNGIGANEWLLPSLIRGFIYVAEGGANVTDDGAFRANNSLTGFPRSVLHFIDDNSTSTGLLQFNLDVLLDDNTPINPLTFQIELYAWNDDQAAPILSSAGETANESTYEVTQLGDATTILNLQLPASEFQSETFETISLGVVNIEEGFDNYVWRIGVFGHDLFINDGTRVDDVFGFDNLTVSPIPESIDITSVEIAENGNFTLEFISPSGNVDIYRSTDLINFGSTPIATNVSPPTYVDAANSGIEKAFYLLVPTGLPLPQSED